MTKAKFKKGVSIAEVLPHTIKMVGKEMPLTTDAVEYNKHSLKDLDKVLEQIEFTPEQLAKLKQIIEANK
tara:strand:+ start:1371 stop:1580 length:210 start_codon:yes stop_codon:yes gene_type:complete